MNHPWKFGLAAGLAATVPMTIAFKYLNRKVPREERLPIPPKEVGEAIVEKTGLSNPLRERKKRRAAIWSAHYAFGAAGGSLFPVFARRLRGRWQMPYAAAGAIFGLAVWAGSYLGWLPIARILPPETQRPKSRRAVNIGAHLVWGTTLGALFHALARKRASCHECTRPGASARNDRWHFANDAAGAFTPSGVRQRRAYGTDGG